MKDRLVKALKQMKEDGTVYNSTNGTPSHFHYTDAHRCGCFMYIDDQHRKP